MRNRHDRPAAPRVDADAPLMADPLDGATARTLAPRDRRSSPADGRPRRASAGPRVAYVVGSFPSLTTTFIERELRALDELDVEVDVLSIRRPVAEAAPVGPPSAAERSPVYLLELPWTRVLRAHLHFLATAPARYLATLAYLATRRHPTLRLRGMTVLHFAEGVVAAHHLRDGSFQHVHAHFVDRGSTVAMCVSRLLGIPYSLTAHARSIFADPVLLPEKLAGAKFVVTVSEFNKAHLAGLVPDLDEGHFHVLHPWVDLAQFDAPEQRVPAPRLRILSVGRLVEKKGHEHLVRACAGLAARGVAFECHIVGDGPLRGRLEDLVAELDLEDRVRLHGAQAQPTVLAMLREADVFVLACVVASTGDRDAMPVAIAEAMAMRLPVVSTTIVGIGEMVRPGTGFLVPPAEPTELADAIHRIDLLGPDGRAQMGDRARAVIAEAFDIHEGTKRLADLYQQSADAHAQRRRPTGSANERRTRWRT